MMRNNASHAMHEKTGFAETISYNEVKKTVFFLANKVSMKYFNYFISLKNYIFTFLKKSRKYDCQRTVDCTDV